MPATAELVDAREHVMQSVPELVEQRDEVVVREQRIAVQARAAQSCTPGEATGVCSACAPSGRRQRPRCVVHPGARALAGARKRVEIELTHQDAVALDAIDAHAVVPHRGLVGRDAQLEQRLDNRETARRARART